MPKLTRKFNFVGAQTDRLTEEQSCDEEAKKENMEEGNEGRMRNKKINKSHLQFFV